MTLFPLLAALLIEWLLPLEHRRFVRQPLAAFAHGIARRLDAGGLAHGALGWLIGVGGLTALAALGNRFFYASSPLLGELWSVLALYASLGFGRAIHDYADIRWALCEGNLARARALLAAWREVPSETTGAEEESAGGIAASAIRMALTTAHRRMFGVLLLFLVFGAAGAVFYRAAEFFAAHWLRRSDDDPGGLSADFGLFSCRAFALTDWLPARATALGFAIAGNFEEAIYRWKTKAEAAETLAECAAGDPLGIVLASGAGALGLRLNGEADTTGSADDEIDTDAMDSAAKLIRRTLLLWLALVSLLWLVRLSG